MLNAVWRLTARSCLFCCHEQFVDTPTREKGPFLWDGANESEGVMRAYGDQNMTWQALRDVARGQSRYWPDGQVNAVYPNGDGARTFGTSTARYPEWLWRYFASTGDRATLLALYPSATRAVDWLWSTRQAGTGLLYGLADTDNGDPVYGYDLSVAADTASNVLAVNAMGRVAQLATMAGDTAAAATWQTRATQLAARRQRACCGAPTASTSTASTPTARRAATPPRRPTRWRSPTAWCRPPTWPPSGATWRASASTSGPTTASSSCAGWRRRTCPTAMVRTLTDTSMPGWAHIVAAGGTFTWEVWKPSDLIGDSLSHGWGSSALVAMQETLLGVTLERARRRRHGPRRVAPPSAGLARAGGSVPTIAGPVRGLLATPGRA